MTAAEPLTIAPRSGTTAALTLRVVTDAGELAALVPAWQALLRESASDEPMLSPTWLRPWWDVYGAGRALRVGLFHAGDRLVGLAPLCARRFWYRPGIPFRRLEFMGADVDEQDGVCSDYLNLIAAAGYEAAVAQAFTQAVAAGSFGRWDELVLAAMDGAGPTPDLLLDAFHGLGYAATKETTCEAPYLPLPGSWDDYLKSLNKHGRRHMLDGTRNFERWAEGDWRIERVATEADLPRGLAILEQLHNQRWQEGEGVGGAFARPRFVAFHQAYLPALLREGRLNLFWLTARGEPVAAHYEIVANGKVYYYQCGRSMAVPPQVSVGTALLIYSIQDAIARGLREFDFLAGLSSYKRKFTQTTRPVVQVRVARSGPAEWLRRAARAAIDTARRLRRPTPAPVKPG